MNHDEIEFLRHKIIEQAEEITRLRAKIADYEFQLRIGYPRAVDSGAALISDPASTMDAPDMPISSA